MIMPMFVCDVVDLCVMYFIDMHEQRENFVG